MTTFTIDGASSLLQAFDLGSKSELRTLALESEPNYLSVGSRGALLIATDAGATVVEDSSFEVLAEIATEVAIYAAALSHDDNFIALGAGDDGKVYLHEASTPYYELIAERSSNCSSTYFVAFSPSSAILASGTDRGTTFIWSIPTLALIRTLVGHSHYVVPGTFLSETILVTGSWDQTCRVWNVSNGECARALADGTDRVRWVATSPDFSMFASACDDGNIRLYNADTFTLMKTIALQNSVTRLCFVDCSCILAGVANIGLQSVDLESRTVTTISPLRTPRGIVAPPTITLHLPPIVI